MWGEDNECPHTHHPASAAVTPRPVFLSVCTHLAGAHHPLSRPGGFGSRFQNHKKCFVALSLESVSIYRFLFPPFSPSCDTELKKQDCWPSVLFLHVPLLCISCHSRHPVVTSRAVFSSVVAICQVWLFKFKQLK